MTMEPKIESGDFEALVRDACGTEFGQSEKASVYKWLDEKMDQNQPFLLLDGESGSGKTQLVRKVISRTRHRQRIACVGNSDPANGPYAPFALALQNALETRLPEGIRSDLETFFNSRPELDELIGRASQTKTRIGASPEGRKALFQAFAQAFLILASRHAALVVIENVHLADAATLEFLEYLASRGRLHKLKILATTRTNGRSGINKRIAPIISKMNRTFDVLRISLGGLTERETFALIRSCFRRNLFSEAFRNGIYHGTNGNPAAVSAVLKIFESQGTIYQEMGVWKERRKSGSGGSPDELYQSVAKRLEQLGPEVVHFLRLAALSGDRFDPFVIQDAMDVNRVRLMRILGVLHRIHGVVAPLDEYYQFTAEQIRKALTRRIPGSLRATLHQQLGDAIESRKAESLDEVADVLANHFRLGGNSEKALIYLTAAGDRCARYYAHSQAKVHYEHALEILTLRTCDYETVDDQMSILQKAGRAHTRLRNWEEAEQHLQNLITLARKYEDRRTEAAAWKGIGLIYARRKDLEKALGLYQHCLQIYLEQHDKSGECDALVKIGSIYLEQGRWEDLQTTYDCALQIARDIEDDRKVATICMNLGIMHGIRNDLELAMEAYQDCLKIYRSLEMWDKLTGVLLNVGKSLADHGDFDRAKKYYSACKKLARKHYDILHEAMVQLNICEILLADNHLEKCREVCQSAMDQFQELDHRIGMADGYRILGCIESALNDDGGAGNHFEKSIQLNRDTGYLLGEAETKRDYAMHLGNRDLLNGIDLLTEARRIFCRLGCVLEVQKIDQVVDEKRRESGVRRSSLTICFAKHKPILIQNNLSM